MATRSGCPSGRRGVGPAGTAGPRPRPLAAAFAVSGFALPPAGAVASDGLNPPGACAHSEMATANATPVAAGIKTELEKRIFTSASLKMDPGPQRTISEVLVGRVAR